MKRQKNMGLRAIAWLLSGGMMIGLLPALSLTAEAVSTPDISWYTSNTSASTFVISTADELAGLAQLVNEGTQLFSGKTIKLSDSIPDTGINLSSYSSGTGWTPIGMYNSQFKGIFDGNNKTITGLYMNKTTSYCGLFGLAYRAIIKNLRIIDVDITGGGYTGGLLGAIESASEVINCAVTGTVKGTNFIGGIAGKMNGSDTYIKDCSFSGNVSGAEQIGGIVGRAASLYSYVQNCYTSGKIKGETFAGGIAGVVTESSKINNCGSTSDVSGKNYIGGVAGGVGTVANINQVAGSIYYCYSTGAVSGSTYVGGIAGRAWGYGYGLPSVVKNCAALNSNITGSPANRIAVDYSDSDLSDNIAYDGIYVNGRTVASNTHTGVQGEDISSDSIISNGTIAGKFTPEAGWTTQNGKLPGFGTAVEMPEHITMPVRVTSVSVSPYNPVVRQGSSQTFTAVVTGINNPRKTVTWRIIGNKNSNTKISADGELTVAAEESAASLTVIAVSVEDNRMTGTSTVSLPIVKMISVSPGYTVVQHGQTKQFTAKASGSYAPAGTVTWNISGNKSNKTNISEDGLLTVAGDETAAALTVRATSTIDTAISGTATVNLPTVTSVTVSPSTASVARGGVHKFTAAVSGKNTPSQNVEWSVSGNTSDKTKISASGILTVGEDESGYFELTVKATSTIDKGKFGTAAVTVPVVTSVAIDPIVATVKKGNTKKFTAKVLGLNNPLQAVTWSITGNTSSDTKISPSGILTVGLEEEASILAVFAKSTADTSVFGTAMVNVLGGDIAPTISVNPASKSIPPGKGTSFSVTANGSATLAYQWQVSANGGVSFTNLSNGGIYSGVTTATLVLSAGTTTAYNSFQYRCVVTNSAGSATSAAAILTVSADQPVKPLPGDVNFDGEINIRDVLDVQKHIAKVITISEEQRRAADVDGNGIIDLKDVITIQKIIAKIITLPD